MIEVKVRPGELIDRALKRFKTKVIMSGLLDDLYSKREFETPAKRKERKKRMAIKKMKLLKKQ
jgi:ribosomal protein S21